MRFLALLTLMTSVAFAQSRDVRLRLLAFEPMAVPKDAHAFDPAAKEPVSGTPAPVKGYLNHEGINLNVSGGDILFANTADPTEAKKPENQLAKVTIPKQGKDFMLIFLPVGENKFRILPLDDSIRAFPLGSYEIISLSRFPVKLTLENKAFELKPGQTILIDDIPVRENNHSAMYAYTFVNEKWQRIGAGLWPHPGNKRSVQVFFDNPASKQTELRGFRDISPPVPGEQPSQNPIP